MRTLALGSCLVLALAGCSNDGDRPTDADYDEVASGLGSLASDDGSGDIPAMGDSVSLLGGTTPAGLSIDVNGHVGGLRGGLMFDYMLTCRDASGTVMSECNEQTESGQLSASWSGQLDTPGFSGSIMRSGSWTVTGLHTDVATFDGAGSFDVNASWMFGGTERAYRLSYGAEYDAIGFRTADHVAIRGSAHWDVHAQRMATRGSTEVDADFRIDARITFAADGSATLVLDGSHTYRVTMATGTVTRT